MSASPQLQAREFPKSWRPQPRRMARTLPTSPAERPHPVESAKAAGLRYTTDATPGITRRQSGTGFTYLTPDGRVLRDSAELERIRSLVIPPAWKDVWICADPRGHLQATGRDARGRKQHRYHPQVAGGSGRNQVSPADWLRPRPARRPPPHGRGPAAARAAERKGTCRGRPAAREDAHPRRQRRVRPPEPIVRADDAAGHPCGGERRPASSSSSVGKAASSTKWTSTTGGWHRLSRPASDLPGYELFQYMDEPRQEAVDRVAPT